MAVHGLPRATIDIDVLIRGDDLDRVVDIASLLGFTFKARPMTFSSGAIEIRRISKVDQNDGEVLFLDLLFVTPQIEEAWRTRESVPWRGASLSVVSREGLIALKRFRSSDQDLVDISRLREST